jgi:pantoate--beta-alanine ligase
MIVVTSVEQVRECVSDRRAAGASISLVPTMGNLHAGHRTLIWRAREDSDFTMVSLYVNPFQFGPAEDLDTYPRTEEQDRAALLEDGVDLLFMPDDRVMYPRGMERQTRVEVPHLGSILEGASRPSFFRGVTTVVNRLFNIMCPDVAYFGKKDFQQLVVIKRMVSDLAMRLEIVGVDTVRDADGLALSSRNGYLSPQERRIAAALYRGMCRGVDRVQSSAVDLSAAEGIARKAWAEAGIRPDYASIRRRDDLEPPREGDRDLVMLGAGYVGTTRLIDNVEFSV